MGWRERLSGSTEAIHRSISIVSHGLNPKDADMTKLGMILFAIYLIVDGLLGFGLNIGPAIFLLYLLAIVAGALILIGQLSTRST
jgi:hypothetical protein